MDLLFWGICTIIGITIAAIIIVLGIYFLITKNKSSNQDKKEYTLDKQKEIK